MGDLAWRCVGCGTVWRDHKEACQCPTDVLYQRDSKDYLLKSEVLKGNAQIRGPGAQIGAKNRERVRVFLRTHLGANKSDVAHHLGLSVMAAGRHVRAIRSEWADER